MSDGGEWIRGRGLGRERLAAYLADYLTELGYTVEREEIAEPPSSVVRAELKRMNPAVPGAMRQLQVRFTPTSGGTAASWESPREVLPAEHARVDRFIRELLLHLERTVRTESHGTANLQPVPSARLPWTPSTPGPRGPSAAL
jgi:hypothetical protein